MSEHPIKKRTQLVRSDGWILEETESGFCLQIRLNGYRPLEVEISQEQAFRMLAFYAGGEYALHNIEASYLTHPYEKPEKPPERGGDT